MAQIESIVYKPAQAGSARLAREPLQRATLVAGYGIEGDRKGGHPKRQLNILSFETVQALAAAGYDVTPGALGEQIVVRGLDVDALAAGTRFLLGETALVEVVEAREPCRRFARAQGRPSADADGRLGVIARVVQGGDIRIGDAVTLAYELA